MKFIARWNEKRKKAKVTCIGIQGDVRSSFDTAEGVDHALRCMIVWMIEA